MVFKIDLKNFISYFTEIRRAKRDSQRDGFLSNIVNVSF